MNKKLERGISLVFKKINKNRWNSRNLSTNPKKIRKQARRTWWKAEESKKTEFAKEHKDLVFSEDDLVLRYFVSTKE